MRTSAKLAVIIYIVMALAGIGRGDLNSDLERTLDAIRRVESSDGKDTQDGDGGKGIGPYQIHKNYWTDAMKFLGVDWPYSDARNPEKARKAAKAYVKHYQKSGKHTATPETYARIHNGGPNGVKKKSTLSYWSKVQKHLK